MVIELVQELITNRVPDDVRQVLTGVHYSVLGYDASDKLRPVGSLDAITKIAQVYLLEVHRLEISSIANATVDHAIQTEHGISKLAATLKAKVSTAIADNDHDFAVLQADVSSAFPNSNRHHMRDAVKRWLPRFIGIYDLLYGAPNHHSFITTDRGVQTVQQRDGIIQGSELSMLFFMLYSHAPMTDRDDAKLDSSISDHVLKYADDIYIYGTADKVRQIYHRLRRGFSQIGLSFNPAKSKLYFAAAHQPTIATAADAWPQTEIIDTGLTCLGVPIGNQPWTRSQLEARLDQTDRNLQFCASRCSAQVSLSILQHTASAFQHIVSVLPPDETEHFAAEIDRITADAFHTSLLGDCQPDQLDDRDAEAVELRMKMRLRDGGFGVLSLRDRVRFAFVSTVIKIRRDSTELDDPKSKRAADAIAASSSLTASCQLSIDYIATKHGPGTTQQHLSKMSMSQMIQPVYDHYIHQAQHNLTGEHRQAWVATRHQGANDVITVRPSRQETSLTDYQLRYAVFQRLGMLSKMLDLENHTSPDRSCLGCNRPNITAAHFSNCGHSCTEKHDHVVKCHCAVLDAAGIQSRVELQVPGTQRRIDIFYRDPNALTTTTNVMADVTIVQAYQPNDPTLPNTSKLLAAAAKAKTNKYREDAAAWRAQVQPLAYTTFGAVSNEARQWLDQVERAAMAGGQYFPGIDRRFRVVWRENISFEIARRTADAAEKAVARHRSLLSMLGESE